MSKLKKVILMSTAYVLVAALAIGGTIAYLTSTDSDVNVMTTGNVKIEQHEYERVLKDENWIKSNYEGYGYTADEMQAWTQGKIAYPAVYQDGKIKWDDRNGSENSSGAGSHQQPWTQVGAPGSNQLFDDSVKNVIDKFVFVKNTGKTDAYYRTIIAIECPEELSENAIHTNFNANSRFDYNSDMDGAQTAEDANEFFTTIDGVRYLIYTATYTQILTPGEVSRPSLLQIFLDPEVTNEKCASFGNTWDIYAVTQAVQADGFADAYTALEEAFGDVNIDSTKDIINSNIDKWDGTIDDSWNGGISTAWYNDTEDVFVIETAEELAGLGKLVDEGNTFEGKTIKLAKNLSLCNITDENGEAVCFDPIGSYRKDKAFMGTFDGQGHTIQDLNQNTWALNNGYYYSDLGLGLFGLVKNATIKNLTMDKSSISGESAICGIVAACAYGDCTFENITVTNSEAADYQYYAGGIVGWASGNHKYINCNVDASTTIAAQWGDFDNSTGGLIGGTSGSAEILIKDTTVACRIDVYNDVTSSYKWYAYRRAGMLIGNSGKTETVDGRTVATCPQLTCENVNVIYGDWANYTYCEFAGTSWPYVRVQAGISNSAYSNPRYGHPTDANGKEVVDDNHVHNDGEDHQILCAFDQLYGGGQGVYGTATHDGVNVVYNNK